MVQEFDVKVARALLERMEVDIPPKSSQKRIGRKVLRAIELQGEPHDLTGAERDLILILQGKTPQSQETTPEDDKAAKASEPKSKKKATAKKGDSSRGLVVQAFKTVFSGKDSVTREKAIEQIAAKGNCPPATVSNYISWAKQTWKKNHFGFHLVETKTEDGKKMLSKTGTGDGSGTRKAKK